MERPHRALNPAFDDRLVDYVSIDSAGPSSTAQEYIDYGLGIEKLLTANYQEKIESGYEGADVRGIIELKIWLDREPAIPNVCRSKLRVVEWIVGCGKCATRLAIQTCTNSRTRHSVHAYTTHGITLANGMRGFAAILCTSSTWQERSLRYGRSSISSSGPVSTCNWSWRIRPILSNLQPVLWRPSLRSTLPSRCSAKRRTASAGATDA